MINFAKFGRGQISAALVSCLFASGCASSRFAHPAATPNSRDTIAIEHRLNAIFSAAQTKDFNRLDSYHLYGPNFTKFSGSSPSRLDAAAGREGEHKGLSAASNLKMQSRDLKIDLFGPTAIATFILDYTFDANGTNIHRQDKSTLVFIKDHGDWKITHEHLSPIQP